MTSNPTKRPVPVPAKEKSNRGRKKEKSQISVRVAQDVWDVAHALAKRNNLPVTEMIERGLVLFLKESQEDLDDHASPRFVFWNSTIQERRRMMVFGLFGRYSSLGMFGEAYRDAMFEMLHKFGISEHFQKALKEFRSACS